MSGPAFEWDVASRSRSAPGLPPDVTASRLRADAWLDTGDIGYLVRGEIHISGRTKELLVVNGEKSFPVDLESAACGLTGVRHCVALLDGEAYHLLVM